jgi:DNA-directed RNA polymerase subunit RPC12/RpoP
MGEDARCPDCDVSLEEADLFTGQGELKVRTEPEGTDDVLAAVGVTKALDVEPLRCPECGLVRFYAEE